MAQPTSMGPRDTLTGGIMLVQGLELFSLAVLLLEIGLHIAGIRNDYRFVDFVTNVCSAMVYTAIGFLTNVVIYPLFETIRSHMAIRTMHVNEIWAWGIGLICADLCHYWFHRAAHRVHLLWGIHQGHHSSDEFNLSIAIRKGIFQGAVDWPFFLPMALLGFPFLQMYLPLKLAQFIGQFWLHNKFIGKLGALEAVLVTPSHHRVHHGRNTQYIDKNYAGLFIVWDRLFGTFTEENEPVVYGITKRVGSANPILIQFTYWRALWRDASLSGEPWARWRIWFMPTEWRPASRRDASWPRPTESRVRNVNSFAISTAALGLRIYLCAQVVLANLITRALATSPSAGLAAFQPAALVALIWTAWSMGSYLDENKDAAKYDYLRLATIAAIAKIPGLLNIPESRKTVILAFALASVAYLATWTRLRRPLNDCTKAPAKRT